MRGMASGDDDIEKLLREVEGVLGGGTAAPGPGAGAGGAVQKASPAPSGQPAADGAAGGPVERVRAGVPVAVAAGAVSGAVMFVVFGVLPFVDAWSGALGAFVAGAGVSLAGRLRRR